MADDQVNIWRHHELELSTSSLARHSGHQQSEGIPEAQSLLHEADEGEETDYPQEEAGRQKSLPVARAFIIRALALLCACSLSVGSH